MFVSQQILLSQLLNRVANGHIQLPDFQRGWVWNDDRIRSLLASISKGFPIGALMTLDAEAEIEFKTLLLEGVPPSSARSPSEFLLDGQQRLTSAYQALLHTGPVVTRDSVRGRKIRRWYYIDMMRAMDESIDRDEAIESVPENRIRKGVFGRDVVRDLSRPTNEFEQHMMPTEVLLNHNEWMFGYVNYWNGSSSEHPSGNAFEFFQEFFKQVIDNFTNYQVPVIKLTKQTPKEAVCTVFEKVNTGGEPLNVFELVTASFAASNFSLREDWKVRQARLYEYSSTLRGIGGDQFLQAVTLLVTRQRHVKALGEGKSRQEAPAIACKKRDVLNLRLEEYIEWADCVEAAFMKVAAFLVRQFVLTQRDLPYNTQLVPLAALYVILGNELDVANAQVRLERWYWSGVFGETYGGSVETQFAEDMEQVEQYIRSGTPSRLMVEANFIPERLLSLRTRNSAAYKGLYAMQMKNGSADWRTGNSLHVATMSSENIDIHHIFPKRWCKEEAKPPIPAKLFNSIINRTPIDAITNRIIGGKGPSVYLPLLDRRWEGVESRDLNDVLLTHWLEPAHLRANRFAESFVSRGVAMLRLIGQSMGKELANGEDVFKEAVRNAGYTDQYDDDTEDYDELGSAVFVEAAD